jgi:hypothetical protein
MKNIYSRSCPSDSFYTRFIVYLFAFFWCEISPRCEI